MKKRFLCMLLGILMLSSALSPAAGADGNSLSVPDPYTGGDCCLLTGSIEESVIDTIFILGQASSSSYPLFTCSAGTTLTVPEDYSDGSIRCHYTVVLTRHDFDDEGNTDWTHAEEYWDSALSFTAEDGPVTLPDGSFTLEIIRESIPINTPVSAVGVDTVAVCFLRVGLGFNVSNPFTDVVDTSYYFAPVLWAVNRGITNGTSATTFSPNDTCTRAQIITFLYRAAGSPAPAKESEITDVAASAYYYPAVQWAAENGMFDGQTFEPNAPCTRLMAVDFIWKAAGSPAAAASGFSDISDNGAVNWAVEAGVTNGTSTTTFSPENICTRAQIVTFLYRAFV
ncbi:MAG: S-layer homology domain-containing protein [Eubacteriales bacterium]|nr:S-layer homology domain-containing protein [Eubacteriales bacterium]